MTTVVSIQSAVAYGHAGNSSAVFPLQRSGIDVWPVHTVNFSNHTGYGAWRGPLIESSDVWEVVQGIDDRGVLGAVDALLCGYQGTPEVGRVILDTARLIKERNPQAVFCADPVMGDVDRGFYARPGIPEFWRDHVVQHADIMTPNLFELEFLTGRALTTLDDVVAQGHNKVILNLHDLQYMNSTGLNILISVLTSTRNKGGDTLIARVSHSVRQLFVVTKLDSVFIITDTVDEAIAKLKG